VLIPTPVLAGFLPLIALISWLLALPISRVAGGNRRTGAATGTLSAYLLLGAYEWCHYLIHTPYVPRGRLYKAIRRSHRLHHYKNERYWFGVTSNVGDRVLGTNPDQAEVTRSPTARALHAERDPA
jgi:sterol desaturase/sphingolipid hydroxylase (fatty acid hydroxylase superfamily)